MAVTILPTYLALRVDFLNWLNLLIELFLLKLLLEWHRNKITKEKVPYIPNAIRISKVKSIGLFRKKIEIQNKISIGSLYCWVSSVIQIIWYTISKIEIDRLGDQGIF